MSQCNKLNIWVFHCTFLHHYIQPLILQDEKAVKIVQNYIDILRPTSTHPQLFLQYNGKPFQQGAMSQHIKQYFQRNAGLN